MIPREEIIPYGPGPMMPDVEPSKQQPYEHQLVQNVRIKKHGQWESVKGFVNSKTGLSDIRAAIPVTDDISGDRFILYQNGSGANCLKRLDYDDGDGDGYQNELQQTLTLPAGVTIGDVTLRFFYYRGVVRITGGSKPLWYGWIRAKTLFVGAIEEIEAQYASSSTYGWLPNDLAVITPYTAPHPRPWAYTVSIDQNSRQSGYAYKQVTVTPNRECRITCCVFRETDVYTTKPVHVNAGTTHGASDLGQGTTLTQNAWVQIEFTFTPTVDTIYLSIVPCYYWPFAMPSIVRVSCYRLEQDAECNIAEGWYLEPTEVVMDDEEMTNTSSRTIYDAGTVSGSLFGKAAFVFDDAQYSLPAAMETNHEMVGSLASLLDFSDTNADDPHLNYKFRLNGTNLRDSFPWPRLTHLDILLSYYTGGNYTQYNEDELTWYVNNEIDLKKAMPEIGYTRELYNFQGTYTHWIWFWKEGESEPTVKPKGDCWMRLGDRIVITNDNGSVDARVTWEGNTSLFALSKVVTPALVTGNNYIDPCGIRLYPRWRYSAANGYEISLGITPLSDQIAEYFDVADILAGAKDTNPNYSHHDVIDGRGEVLSIETDEGDLIRYSPINQPDVLPNNQTFHTEIGDTDRNLALINRDNRTVILKRNSLSQMSFQGNGFTTDIGIAKHGLYATLGYLVVKDILYYMDMPDVFAFTGTRNLPLLETAKQRSYYREHVSTSSLIGYNNLDKELWFFLTGTIMVFQMDFKTWYVRSHNITPRGAFLTIDKEFYLFNGTKFVRLNHGLDTFSESIGIDIKSKLYDRERPDQWKKMSSFELLCQANADLIIAIEDEVNGVVKPITVTPSASNPDNVIARVDYLFKQADVRITSTPSASDLGLLINTGMAKIDRMDE